MLKIKLLFTILLIGFLSFICFDRLNISNEKIFDDVKEENISNLIIVRPVVDETSGEVFLEEESKQEKTKIQTETKTTNTKSNNTKETNNNSTKQEKVETETSKVEESKEEKQENTTPEESTNTETEVKKEPKVYCEDFFESIHKNRADVKTKEACLSYGNRIVSNELDEVLDYNEIHGNVRNSTIIYFTCYEVFDDNCKTKGWYLHFTCNSSDCDDNKIKKMYG